MDEDTLGQILACNRKKSGTKEVVPFDLPT